MTRVDADIKRMAVIFAQDDGGLRSMVAEFSAQSALSAQASCECLLLPDRFRGLPVLDQPYDCLILVVSERSQCRWIGHAGRALADNKKLCSCMLCVAAPNNIKATVLDEVLRLRPLLNNRVRTIIDDSLRNPSLIERAVEQCRAAAAYRSARSPLIDRDDCPVGIVHVSDLHTPAWNLDACAALLRDIRQLDMPRVRLLLVSGDVSDMGWGTQIRDARDFIYDMAKNMESGVDTVFVCPGNHDSATRLCGVALPFLPRLRAFRDFFPHKIGADVFGTSWFSVLSVSESVKLGLFVLDSTRSRILARGSVPEDTRNWLLRKGQEFCTENPTGILLATLHHHVMNDARLNNQDALIMIDDGPFKAAACEAGIDILFHGHQHLGWRKDIPGFTYSDHTVHVVSAGSAVKMIGSGSTPAASSTRPNQYNFVLMGEAGFIVFSRQLLNGEFKTSEVKEKRFLRPRSLPA